MTIVGAPYHVVHVHAIKHQLIWHQCSVTLPMKESGTVGQTWGVVWINLKWINIFEMLQHTCMEQQTQLY